MKKIYSHSKNSLFLMEMILVLLFLSLSSVACIRIFAAAGQNRTKAAEWRHMQSFTTSAGEILEGTDGSADSFADLLPGSVKKNNLLIWYYDTDWNTCNSKSAGYKVTLYLESDEDTKKGTLIFYSAGQKQEELYRIDFAFPVTSSKEQEDAS